MRVRKSVHALPAGDETLLWYGRAVAAMKQLPRTNPRSWEFQAAIHGTDRDIPSAMGAYWAQCQHGSSFFLPWHRMYLLHFERIVEAHVVALGGPAEWALPYWNPSADDSARALPEAFRSPTLADGSQNHLWVERRPAVNGGSRFLERRDVDLEPALTSEPTTEGFFGGVSADHSGGEFGLLEWTIHNSVHARIRGYMGNPDFAALDPIFWLHHCNIDRLWDVYLGRGNANLASAYWRTGVSFDFHDGAGNPVTMRTVDVLTGALDYEYDDIRDPLVIPEAVVPPAMAPTRPRELVGATTSPVELGEQVSEALVPTPVSPQAFAISEGLEAVGPPSKLVKRAILRLEHVKSTAHSPVYDVYVNVPGGAAPSAYEDRFVGRVAMFGIVQASDPSGQHAGSGQDFSLDITRLYHRLSDAGEISPTDLRVSFVPVEPEPGTKVSVGRISLYFA
jgi:tyrosinase